MKRLIQILSVCLFPLAVLAVDSSASPIFQLRLVADGPSGEAEAMVVTNTSKEAVQKETLQVEKRVLIDETSVKSARVSKEKQLGQPQIEIRFTEPGKKRFAEVTRENVGKRLAIVIGGQLYSAPKIMTEIAGGSAVISGSFSEQEAKELAAQITKSLKK